MAAKTKSKSKSKRRKRRKKGGKKPQGAGQKQPTTAVQVPARCPGCGKTSLKVERRVCERWYDPPQTLDVDGEPWPYNHIVWRLARCSECDHRTRVMEHTTDKLPKEAKRRLETHDTWFRTL